MSRYSAKSITREGYNVIELRDQETEAIAEIIPEMGNNLDHFEIQGHSIILPPVSLDGLINEPSAIYKYGTPILFPPNRVRNGSFAFKGRTYQLPLNEPPSNHLHGEICSKAWDIVEVGASDDQGAYITSSFRYSEHPEILAYFPHALSFTITYSLINGELRMNTRIINEGDDEAPFAFGLHPYFQLPFDSQEKLSLKVNAANEWPVTNEAFVTGLPSITRFSEDLRKGVDISNYPLLGCSLITLDDHEPVCRIDVENKGYSILYQLDRNFPFVILFRPNWASAFSIEPYTYVTDAFNLPYESHKTGAKGIQTGETFEFQTSLQIEEKAL